MESRVGGSVLEEELPPAGGSVVVVRLIVPGSLMVVVAVCSTAVDPVKIRVDEPGNERK